MSADRLRFSLMAYNYMKNELPCVDNFVFSPLSVEIALSMAWTGAKGKTRQEIAKLLGLNVPGPIPELCGILRKMKMDEKQEVEPDDREDYEPLEYYKLYMANGVFVDEFLDLDASYRKDLTTLFQAACFPVQFTTDPDGAAGQINDYIEQNTMGLLRDVVSPQDITLLTRFILINTLYFKSNWHDQFKENRTVKKPFTTATAAKISVDMMHIRTSCNFYKSKELDGAKFLQMYYSEEICSAIFILPGKQKLFSNRSPDQGLDKLRKLLTLSVLQKAIGSMCAVQYVDIQLPKFRIERRLDMEKMLSGLGMPTAFNELADFSGICSSSSLRISKVKHMAYIDVNEKGTEAAAATVIAMQVLSRPPDTRAKFKANRPFVFFIRHESTKTILFMGSVSDPTRS